MCTDQPGRSTLRRVVDPGRTLARLLATEKLRRLDPQDELWPLIRVLLDLCQRPHIEGEARETLGSFSEALTEPDS